MSKKTLDLNLIYVDEKVIAKSGATIRGRVHEDKGDILQVKVEREVGTAPLAKGGQVMLVVMNAGDKNEALSATIINMLARALKMPDIDGKATKQIGIAELTRFNSVMKAVKEHKNGVITFDDEEDMKYVQRYFSRVQIPADPQSSEIIVNLMTAINRACAKDDSAQS